MDLDYSVDDSLLSDEVSEAEVIKMLRESMRCLEDASKKEDIKNVKTTHGWIKTLVILPIENRDVGAQKESFRKFIRKAIESFIPLILSSQSSSKEESKRQELLRTFIKKCYGLELFMPRPGDRFDEKYHRISKTYYTSDSSRDRKILRPQFPGLMYKDTVVVKASVEITLKA